MLGDGLISWWISSILLGNNLSSRMHLHGCRLRRVALLKGEEVPIWHNVRSSLGSQRNFSLNQKERRKTSSLIIHNKVKTQSLPNFLIVISQPVEVYLFFFSPFLRSLCYCKKKILTNKTKKRGSQITYIKKKVITFIDDEVKKKWKKKKAKSMSKKV